MTGPAEVIQLSSEPRARLKTKVERAVVMVRELLVLLTTALNLSNSEDYSIMRARKSYC